MPLTKERKKELIAPDVQRIFAGAKDGVPNPPKEVLNPNGAVVPSKELTYFRQGYQRGWTEAATLRLMEAEAREQGIRENPKDKDPEWPDYTPPKWVGGKVKNVPTPRYVDGDASIAAYNCGYYRGWMASKAHKTAEKLLKTRIKSMKKGLKKKPTPP